MPDGVPSFLAPPGADPSVSRVEARPVLVPSTAYSRAIRDLGPSLYWRLDDSEGSTALDASGNGNHGTYVGGPTQGVDGGLLNDPDTAVLLDGSTEYISSDYSPFVIGSARTFVVLARRNTSTTADVLVGSSGANQVQIKLQANTDNIQLITASLFSVLWSGAWTTGQWILAVITYDDAGRNAEAYVNGISQGVVSLSGGFSATPGDFKAGARSTGATDPFDGNLDEVAVFERILTATEIANLATIAVGTVFDTATFGGAVAQGRAAGAAADQVIGDSVSGGNPASARAAQVLGGAQGGGQGPGAGVPPNPGGSTGGGQGPAALAFQVIGASVAGGPTPSALATAVVLIGGAIGGAQAPMPTVAVPQGGAVAQGFAPSPVASQVIGPAVAQGRAAGAIAPVTVGPAVAQGYGPSVPGGVTDTAPPGVGAAGGFGPGAAASQVAGGAAAGGNGATASTVISLGPAVAQGRSPAASVAVPAGPAVAGGPDQTAFVLAPVTSGGAVAGVYAPGAYIPATHVIGGAVAAGLGPVGALAAVEPGIAIATGYVPSEVSEGGVGHISHDGAGHVVLTGPGHISGARAGTVSGNGAGDVDRVPAGHIR
jgi:hypothetical protein